MMFRRKKPAAAPNTFLGWPFPDYPGSQRRADAVLVAASVLAELRGPLLVEIPAPGGYVDLASRTVIVANGEGPLVVAVDRQSHTEPDGFDLIRLADYIVTGAFQ